ncbi:MAG: hypothetical protein ACON49_05545 [Candidatus Puniceispirillaceae bacterium]
MIRSLIGLWLIILFLGGCDRIRDAGGHTKSAQNDIISYCQTLTRMVAQQYATLSQTAYPVQL